MWHLSTERLAALADDEPTSGETQHLASCAACARERVAHQDILRTAHALAGREDAPLSDWSSLQSILWEQGLITRGESAQVVASRISRRFLLVAAGLVLLAGGVAAGRMSAGASWLPAPGEVALQDAAPFTSTAEALDVYFRSQQDFKRSAAYLAANGEGPQGSSEAALTRLAALEEIISASAAGLRGAPADPVINDYYMSSLSARDATRRQLGLFTPIGLRREKY